MRGRGWPGSLRVSSASPPRAPCPETKCPPPVEKRPWAGQGPGLPDCWALWFKAISGLLVVMNSAGKTWPVVPSTVTPPELAPSLI